MINNTTENRRVSLLEGTTTSFRLNVQNATLQPFASTTNILLSWNTSGVNDLAISSLSHGGPTSISGTNVVWSIPVSNSDFGNPASGLTKQIAVEVDRHATEEDEKYFNY